MNPDSCGLTITENTYTSVLCDVCGKLSLYTVAKCLLILNSLRNSTSGRHFSLYVMKYFTQDDGILGDKCLLAGTEKGKDFSAA